MAPPTRRPPPLLVLAAGGLVLVLAIGVILVANRSGDRDGDDQPARTGGEKRFAEHSATGSAARDENAAEPTAPAPIPAATAAATAPAHAEPPPAQPPPPAEEPLDPNNLPIWARPPRVTSQPFPEGGRINPPLPPVKIPPEMLVPLPGADAAAPGNVP